MLYHIYRIYLLYFFRSNKDNANPFSELWNEDQPNLTQLLKSKNEDIDELPFSLIQNIQNKILIQKIHKRLSTIETLFFYPQTLTLENCQQLNTTPKEHWTSTIYNLFHDAQIPKEYIFDIYKNENENDNNPVPNTIYIQFKSFQYKMFAKHVLTNYLSLQPNNNIQIFD